MASGNTPSRDGDMERLVFACHCGQGKSQASINSERKRGRVMQDKLTQMAVVDRFIHIRILGLSKWFEPALKQDMYDWPSLVVFSRELVANRMNALEIRGLVKTTPNYCLPKNEAVCNLAAGRILNEILAELECRVGATR